MPFVSSKINQQELDAVAEYANRHWITISNLIRMLLIREVASPRVLTSIAAENATPDNVNEIVAERPRAKTFAWKNWRTRTFASNASRSQKKTYCRFRIAGAKKRILTWSSKHRITMKRHRLTRKTGARLTTYWGYRALTGFQTEKIAVGSSNSLSRPQYCALKSSIVLPALGNCRLNNPFKIFLMNIPLTGNETEIKSISRRWFYSDSWSD